MYCGRDVQKGEIQVGMTLPASHICISFSFATKNEPGTSITQPCWNYAALPLDTPFFQLTQWLECFQSQ